jgi:hypothetical protein
MSRRTMNVFVPALAIMSALILVAAALAVPADAARPKLTRGEGNVQGTSTNCVILADGDLNCIGEISGLGGSPVAHLEATVEADFECFNPAGQGPNPGHSGPVTVSSPSQVLDVENGKAIFDLTIQAPSGPDEPNPSWTCNLVSISYDDVVVVVDTVSGEFGLALGDFSA